ncbi:hypothetical protein PsorP6_014126 [Peronosclerospora sorghi]|uniref:Uncharacterized protein n=1 Tax=Peronosclerospora sorghi TaxID=230839 RepID=A0ACC0VGK2_9STRA|nr:hypothetical protein PsorP6_014126 [Peronosclerospora sorghi]
MLLGAKESTTEYRVLKGANNAANFLDCCRMLCFSSCRHTSDNMTDKKISWKMGSEAYLLARNEQDKEGKSCQDLFLRKA